MANRMTLLGVSRRTNTNFYLVGEYDGAWATRSGWLTSETDGTTSVNDQRLGLGTDRPRQPGRALTFDGTQSSTSGTAEEQLDITSWTTFYFSAWFKTSNSGQMFIYAVRHTGADDLRFWMTAGSIQCQLDDGTVNGQVVSEGGFNDGQWHRAVVTFDGATLALTIYDAAGNVEGSQSTAGSFDFATADGLARLANRPNGGSFQWIGELSDVQFGQNEDNLEVHYKLEDNSSEDIIDSSGKDRHAQLLNSPAVYEGADVPKSYANEVGYSLLRNHVPHTTGDWVESITEWRVNGAAVLTKGQADPFGGTEALLLDQPVDPSADYIYVSCNRTPALASTTYTASIWIKQGTRTDQRLTIDDNSFAGDRYEVKYDWGTGLTTESGTKAKGGVTLDHGVAEIDGDWVRIYITFTTWAITGGFGDFQFMLRGGASTGTGYWAGPQIELGTEVTDFQRNFNSYVGTIIPRDESNPTKDAFGNDLQYIGEAPNPGQALAHNVLKLDGTQNVETGIFPVSGTSARTVRVRFTFDNLSSGYFIFGWGSNSAFGTRFDFRTSSTGGDNKRLRLEVGSGYRVWDIIPVAGVEYEAVIAVGSGERTGDVHLWIDGVEQAEFDVGDNVIDTGGGDLFSLDIGKSASLGTPMVGKISAFQVWDVELTPDELDNTDNLVIDIPCAEGIPGSTVNAVTERVSRTSLPIFNASDNWATSDYGPHVNMEQGFSAAHNEVLSSSSFATNWFALGVGSTLETDYADGPNVPNVGRASRLTLPQISGTYLPYRDHTSSGGTYTLSCWAKKTPGSTNPQFSFFKSHGGTTWSTPITTTDEWVRYSWSVALPAGTNELGLNNANDSFSTDILIAGFQVTPTTDVVPYYPTTDTLFYTGTRIPADLTDPTLDALGNVLTNPLVVGNNDSESTLIFTKEPDDPANYLKDIPGNGTLAAAAFDGDYGDVVVGVDLPKREGQFYLPKLDKLTWNYISQVKAAGGAIGSEAYSDLYSKQRLNDFIVALRDIGVWDATLEMYLFGGPVDFAGSLVKLKTYRGISNTLTNNAFVAGDLNQTGPLLGLKGDGPTYLSTGLLDTIIPVDSGFAACVVTEDSGATFDVYAGVEVSGNSQCYKFGENTPAGRLHAGNSAAGGTAGGYVENFFSTYPEPQVIIFDMTTPSDIGIYVDGGANIATMSGLQSFRNPTGVYDLTLFGLNRTGTVTDRTVARLPLIIIGKDTLTGSQRAGLNSAIKMFLNAFGAEL